MGENKKEREIREKEKMSAGCGRLLSIFKHAATQVSVQASPSHSPHRPHDMLNVCVYVFGMTCTILFQRLGNFDVFHSSFVCILTPIIRGVPKLLYASHEFRSL